MMASGQLMPERSIACWAVTMARFRSLPMRRLSKGLSHWRKSGSAEAGMPPSALTKMGGWGLWGLWGSWGSWAMMRLLSLPPKPKALTITVLSC